MISAPAVILAGYITAILCAMFWPGQRRHPEDGQAIGCLSLVIIALLALGVILGIGALAGNQTTVSIVFAIAVFPLVLLVPQVAFAGYRKYKRSRGQ